MPKQSEAKAAMEIFSRASMSGILKIRKKKHESSGAAGEFLILWPFGVAAKTHASARGDNGYFNNAALNVSECCAETKESSYKFVIFAQRTCPAKVANQLALKHNISDYKCN